MARTPGNLVVHRRSAGVAMGTLDAFFVMRAYGDISPEDVMATAKCAPLLKAFRPEGTASIVVIDPTSTFPSEETRRAAVQVSRETGGQTVGLAFVVLGDGFWASAIRGVVTTVMSLSPSSHPRKVFRREEEAVAWAAELVGDAQSYVPALLSALQELRPATTTPIPSIDPPSSPKPTGAGSKVPPSSKRRAG